MISCFCIFEFPAPVRIISPFPLKQPLSRAKLSSSGSGRLDRRWALAVSSGPFDYLGKDLQSPTAIQRDSAGDVELLFDDLPGAIGPAGRVENDAANGPRHQIGQLEATGIGFLVREHDFEGQLLASKIFPVADPAELKLELLVFGGTSTFHDHVGFPVGLPLLIQETIQALQGEFHGQMVDMLRSRVFGKQGVLLDCRGDDCEGCGRHELTELLQEGPTQVWITEKAERPMLLPDLRLVEDYQVVPEVFELKALYARDHLTKEVVLPENAERQDEQREDWIDLLEAVIPTFVYVNNEIAILHEIQINPNQATPARFRIQY